LPSKFKYGWFDTGGLMTPSQKVCAYATTFVRAAEGSRVARPLTLWVGTSGAFKLFYNGAFVLGDEAHRGHDPDRFAASVTLEPGVNTVTLKLCGDEDAPSASLRVGDARGASDPRVEISSDPALAVDAAALVTRLAKRPRRSAASALGPLQQFEKSTTQPRASAHDLFAYAEYLVATSSDDPKEHRARDLARRAAEREPTIERLLLAGELAEDRNQQGDWITRAENLSRDKTAPELRVLLARAAHTRGSANWRDAFPYYERALALDPDNVIALRGRMELYNEAGLPRTAVTTLEQALARAPRSVALLHLYAAQLRQLGRTTEAAEVESRYSALRFDDAGYLGSMVELSLLRRNRPAAERWVQRLLELAPDSQWALGVAARAYRSLGDPERAVAIYREALELSPEDVGTLRTLADLLGELGRQGEQLTCLRQILKIQPQAREVREYVEHIEAPTPRKDEAYAWQSARFLPLGKAPSHGEDRRTLRDLTVTTVFANGKASQFRQVVFQPLSDAAAAQARQYGFQYQADREVVQLRAARVYRKDGKIDEAVEYGEAPVNIPEIAMYTSARMFYVDLPRLEPGDVVELRYRLDDIAPRNEFADYFGEVVYFGGSDPVANAEYVLITPKSRTFYLDAQVPRLQRKVQEEGEHRIYRFVAAEVPPVLEEPAMPPAQEVLGFVHVSTYPTWDAVGRWYWGLSRDQLDLDDETRELARRIAKDARSDLDKVRAVYDWVVKNTRYVALEFGIYGYKPRRAVQTIARGWGDCKDKAVAIVSLLKELGIPAHLVIVRTGLRGNFRSKVASLAPFDHAIAYVPSLDLYLDGTAEYAGTTELPAMDQGAMAIEIGPQVTRLVTLPQTSSSADLVRRTVQSTVAPNGSARLEVRYLISGSPASEWRRRFHAEATLRDRVQRELLAPELPGFSLLEGPTGVQTNDLNDSERPVELTVRGTSPSFARHEGGQLSIAVTRGAHLVARYASLPRRRQDVRILGLSNIEDTFSIKLPPGYRVLSSPQDAKGETAFGRYAVSVASRPGEVVVKSSLALKLTRISPQQYPDFKRFCGEVDSAFSPRLLVSP
jgi:tetratricopeptide (TPR) repeat protein